MKIVSTFIGNSSVKKDWKIYESVEEFEKSGHELKELEEAEENDYVRSDNGYYVPLIRKYFAKSKHSVKQQMQRFHFPLFIFSRVKYIDKNKYSKKYFLYTVDPEIIEYKKMKAKFVGLAQLIAAGTDPFHAMKKLYPRADTRKRWSLLKQIFQSKVFISYLMRHANMEPLKDTLKSEGINYGFLAKHLKELIDTETGKTKLSAITTAFDILSKAEYHDQIDKKSLPEKTEYTIEENGKKEDISKRIAERAKHKATSQNQNDS